MNNKEFKASHFNNIQELIDTCKMWIKDDDYDAYCRFFDMGAMQELIIELEKRKHKDTESANNRGLGKLKAEAEIVEDKPIEELDMRKMGNIVGTEISKFMQGFFESLDEDVTKLFKEE
jgi:hypothetical protein